MECKSVVRALGLAVVACALVASDARADVFNLGGTQNADGTWNGLASLATVGVGNPGNPGDTNPSLMDGSTGYGAVSYVYSIGKYDVTAAQYTEFLNAVAKTDPYGLYNPNMANPASAGVHNVGCGIARIGTPGNYTYSTTEGGNYPVNYVSWGDAARFCNWLQNGQPTGQPEGNGTTETGSYTLNGAITTSTLGDMTRNTGAVWCIPTENEWYKAAYFKGGRATDYWYYATRSDDIPSNELSATGTDNANYEDYLHYFNGGLTDPINFLTAVGAFAASHSAYGTFDQGGNVEQWTETGGSRRTMRGGSFKDDLVIGNNNLCSGVSGSRSVTDEYYNLGFRIVALPEPASLGILSIGVIGMLVRRRGARN